VLYVRAIQPGAADVAHYRVKIPKDAKGPISLSAKLNYRKFSHFYTQFAYAGEDEPGQDPSLRTKDHSSQEMSFVPANIPANVSGKIKGEIPNLPIVVLADASAKLKLNEPQWTPVVQKIDRERWNDWGIGLLLQGDLKGAEYAFLKVTEAEPAYADGWLNVARALIQEGETEAAKPFIKKALANESNLGRIYYFKGLIEKADGEYDLALTSFRPGGIHVPARSRCAESNRAHSFLETRVCTGNRSAQASGSDRSGRSADALYFDAVLSRPRRFGKRRARRKAVHAVQGGRIGAIDHGQAAADQSGRQQRTSTDSRSRQRVASWRNE
jgi:tetratricopeptide (TPR) repeat protein